MEKKWWSLIFMLVVCVVAVVSMTDYLGKRTATILQGAVIIIPPDHSPNNGGPTNGAGSNSGTGAGGSATTDGEGGGPPPDGGLKCWRCPNGGVIQDVRASDLTVQMVQNLTNCTTISQLVQIECSTGATNQTNQTNQNQTTQTNQTCGNGICESYENATSCPRDCLNSSFAGSNSNPASSEGENNPAESDKERAITPVLSDGKPKQLYYFKKTFDGQCAKLFGKGTSNCDPNNPAEDLSGDSAGEGPTLSPPESTFILYEMIKYMFGLPRQ